MLLGVRLLLLLGVRLLLLLGVRLLLLLGVRLLLLRVRLLRGLALRRHSEPLLSLGLRLTLWRLLTVSLRRLLLAKALLRLLLLSLLLSLRLALRWSKALLRLLLSLRLTLRWPKALLRLLLLLRLRLRLRLLRGTCLRALLLRLLGRTRSARRSFPWARVAVGRRRRSSHSENRIWSGPPDASIGVG
ncbi:hypothetical protein [Ruania zhangjianzhongii]|uniref:hypothetical protein n=1 Tax=Ruania zhangjianzhongii TaxID=2603206 RepID=UPI0011C755EE|nr:hypothetical protein [Ruania zhangjianzhongii]